VLVKLVNVGRDHQYL